jgi:hypothetical protein
MLIPCRIISSTIRRFFIACLNRTRGCFRETGLTVHPERICDNLKDWLILQTTFKSNKINQSENNIINNYG